jgi:hypothetical protein
LSRLPDSLEVAPFVPASLEQPKAPSALIGLHDV